jgi:hypothetical protein
MVVRGHRWNSCAAPFVAVTTDQQRVLHSLRRLQPAADDFAARLPELKAAAPDAMALIAQLPAIHFAINTYNEALLLLPTTEYAPVGLEPLGWELGAWCTLPNAGSKTPLLAIRHGTMLMQRTAGWRVDKSHTGTLLREDSVS